jgi:hypothetical protein
MEIVINRCWGGFNLSKDACALLKCEPYDYDSYNMRNDFNLISAIKTLGSRADGIHANLVIREIPDESTDYKIIDYDGMESIIYVLNGKLHFA